MLPNDKCKSKLNYIKGVCIDNPSIQTACSMGTHFLGQNSWNTLVENTQHQNTLTGSGKVLNLFTSDMENALNLVHNLLQL